MVVSNRKIPESLSEEQMHDSFVRKLSILKKHKTNALGKVTGNRMEEIRGKGWR